MLMPADTPDELPSPWYSRGYLPHCDRAGLLQGITFHLDDSLPKSKLVDWAHELRHLEESKRDIERQRRIAEWLDRGHGACWLRQPRIAAIVEETLLKFDGERYHQVAWCIMPNHVHALVETREGWSLPQVIHSWKSYTAQMANRMIGRRGTFWQREYFDRFIRDDNHYANAVNYIEENPVKAGLVSHREDWRWSSSWQGRTGSAGRSAGTPAGE